MGVHARFVLVALLPLAAACGGGGTDEPATAPTTTASSTTAPTTTSTTTTTTTTLEPALADLGPPTLDEASHLSTVGLDTVTFGMTVATAQEAAGTALVPLDPLGDCYRVAPVDAPEGIVFVVSEGTIERADITAGPVTTRSGVGIGTPESRVIELFGDRIERQVSADGRVALVFVPRDPNDAAFRVVFDIDDGVVSSLRAGRVPLVFAEPPCPGA
ncbi:MAG: hypothetical protein D6683_06750 [Actinomyces sp.]|nr:MAG: hypothetical protein D6683_06750 [Actinomyces sp.]